MTDRIPLTANLSAPRGYMSLRFLPPAAPPPVDLMDNEAALAAAMKADARRGGQKQPLKEGVISYALTVASFTMQDLDAKFPNSPYKSIRDTVNGLLRQGYLTGTPKGTMQADRDRIAGNKPAPAAATNRRQALLRFIAQNGPVTSDDCGVNIFARSSLHSALRAMTESKLLTRKPRKVPGRKDVHEYRITAKGRKEIGG